MTSRHPWSTRLLCIATVTLLAGCGGGGDDQSPSTPTPAPVGSTAPGILSISASPQQVPAPTTGAQADAYTADAQNAAYFAGARGQVTTYTWSGLEPTPNSYNASKFAELSAALTRAQTQRLTQFVGIQLINTTVKDVPPDLVNTDFANATFIARFHALMDRVVGQHVGQIKYLSIGNEIDAYLSAHPSAVASYKTFFADAARYVRGLDPAIKIGITGTADGALGNNAVLLNDVNSVGTDVVILTYYPLTAGPTANTIVVRPPAQTATDFTRMIAFAGSKPLILQEVGYPAGTSNNSSEAMQATFIRQVFTSWQGANGKIAFLNVFLLHDFTTQTCTSFLTYYGLPQTQSYIDYLCTLGLMKVDGTQRQAWPALLDAAKSAGFP